jgi:hypothetical protein
MGVFPGKFSTYKKPTDKSPVEDKNPNPRMFQILELEQVGKHCVAKVKYSNCTNYEGRKILVFLNCKISLIKKLTYLDPHFTNEIGIHPFARFAPTIKGWRAAIKLLQVLE